MKAHIKKFITATLSLTLLANNAIIATANNEADIIYNYSINDIESQTQEENIAEIDNNIQEFNCECESNDTSISFCEQEINTNETNAVSATSSESSYTGTCGENLNYSFDEWTGTLTITGSGKMYDYTSTSAAPWNSVCNRIFTIEIETTVSYIGEYAFANFSNLVSIQPISIDDEGLKTYHSGDILDSINMVGAHAFQNCTSLQNVSVNSKTIGVAAFQGCTSLANVTIGDNAELICNFSFSGCNNITSIEVGKNVNYVETPFNNMRGLETITVDPDNQYFSSDENGFFYNKNKTKLMFIPMNYQGTTVTIPSSVKSLYGNALNGNLNIENLNISPDVIVPSTAFTGSHFLQVWNTSNSNLNFHDQSGNHYLIAGGCVLDFKLGTNANTCFDISQQITNSNNNVANIKAVSLIGDGYKESITDIVIKSDTKIAPNTFDKTGWYKTTSNNVLYNNVNHSEATYKSLYRYNSQSSQLNLNLAGFNGIEANAFKNVSRSLSLNISSTNMKKIDSQAFIGANISEISIDNNPITYEDFKFSHDDFIHIQGERSGYAFKNESDLKVQLFLATVSMPYSSEYNTYRDIIENQFCNAIIDEMGWRELVASDPYKAIFEIQTWITKNNEYDYWFKESDCFSNIDASFNNKYYSEFLSVSGCALGSVGTGHIVCGGFSSISEKIIYNLGNESLKYKGLGSSTHAFGMIGIGEGVNRIWYYTEPQGVNLLGQGSTNWTSDIYSGYRKSDIHMGIIENTLKANQIYYSYVDENGNTVILNNDNSKGTLSENDYSYPETRSKTIKVYKAITNSNNVNISFSTPSYIKKCSIRKPNLNEGCLLFTDTSHNVDSLTINVALENSTYNVNINASGIFTSTGTLGNYLTLPDNSKLYYYLEREDSNTIKFVISDQNQLTMKEKINYKITDNANVGSVAIVAKNGGNVEEYSVKSSAYTEVDKYVDFTGYVSICGVNVKDISDLNVGTSTIAVVITDKGIRKTVICKIVISTNSSGEKCVNITIQP